MKVDNRTKFIAAGMLLFAAAVIVALNVQAPTDGKAAQPVTSRQASYQIYGLGTVEARTLARLGFELAGTITKLEVDQGDKVMAGNALANLDSRHQQAKVAQAEALVRQAQAGILQAQAQLERARVVNKQRSNVNARRQELVRRGNVSVETAEEAQTNSTSAGADVAVALSDLDAAKAGMDSAVALLQLERAVLAKYALMAPFDGLIVSRTQELGAAAVPGATIFTIADPSSVWIEAFIDEALAGQLRLGQKVEINLRSQPGQAHSGRIARIDIENNRVSEERLIHVAFDSPPSPFFLGEQAEILVDAPRETK